MRNAATSWVIFFAVMALTLMVSPRSRAVTILTGPTFTPATNAPLAGLLRLTTDVDTRVKVVISEGTNACERNFYDFATTHSVPLLGFKPARTNLIQVTVYDKYRTASTATSSLAFVAGALPGYFPKRVVLKRDPERMEPGYNLFMVQVRNGARNYIAILDNAAEVVWYATAPGQYDNVVRQLDNGNLFIVDAGNRFQEINMLGDTVRTLNAPAAYPVDLHEGVPTGHGTILYISQTNRIVNNFPSSSTDPDAPLITVTVKDNLIVEISATNAALLNVWSCLDLLDPTHITYLTWTGGALDFEHANAIFEDTRDNSIIVSLRNQNAVFKFSRDPAQLKWILSPPANWGDDFLPYLLTPVGTTFEWSYAQHAPTITPQGTLLLYDNGNFRASPFDDSIPNQDNYSRAVEYHINETNLTVSQVWDSTSTNEARLFTPIICDADWLPQRQNMLVTYGYVTFINGVRPSAYSANATMVRIKELTHDPVPEVVFDLSLFDYSNTAVNYLGYYCYRSDRIPDLYPHPAKPVANLVVSVTNQTPCLEFSADPVRTYVVEASTDLVNWAPIGAAGEAGGAGDFVFDDLAAGQYSARYYRVATQ
jgi:arylsulfate sulfotransferase